MAINETIGLVASFITAGGKALSRRATNVTIMDTSSFTNVVINKNYLGTAGLDSGWYVKRNLDLTNVFTDIMGRQPRPNENVRFILESDVAVIGDYVGTGYIKLMASGLSGGYWENGGKIELHNYGWISGLGRSSEISSSFKAPGGTAISAITPLLVHNYGLITGGGGSGGIYDGNWGSCYSGAGAPLGNGYPPRSQPATLLQPSTGYRTTSWSQPFQSGKGGAPGEPGESVPPINWSDLTHPGDSGGLPGFVSEGNVTIINKGSGRTKGMGA